MLAKQEIRKNDRCKNYRRKKKLKKCWKVKSKMIEVKEKRRKRKKVEKHR